MRDRLRIPRQGFRDAVGEGGAALAPVDGRALGAEEGRRGRLGWRGVRLLAATPIALPITCLLVYRNLL